MEQISKDAAKAVAPKPHGRLASVGSLRLAQPETFAEAVALHPRSVGPTDCLAINGRSNPEAGGSSLAAALP